MTRIYSKAWELWLTVFLLFGLHRAFSFSYLADALLVDRQEPLIIFLSGLLSDFWMAAVAALLFVLTSLAMRPVQPGSDQRRWAAAWVVCLGFMTALHQPYLEFFRFQFIPFHARYFFDAEFMVASLASLANPRAFALCVLTLAGAWGVGSRSLLPTFTPLRATVVFIVSLAVATIGHAANIHYKVQLFVPTELQVHYLERLVQHLGVPQDPSPLTVEEHQILQERMGVGAGAAGDFDRWLRRATNVGRLDPLAENLRREFATRVKGGEKPLLLTVMLESARYVDAGRGEGGVASITPQLDALAASGISFPVAYSTGMVTRGGQEAAWCGHLSNVTTSMMRDRPGVKLDCLPRIFAKRLEAPSFWLHGGRGEFDSQEHFWAGQGVQHLLVSKDFPTTVAKSGWGVSDRALFQRSLSWLEDHHATIPGPFLNGMILTMTNHTPFSVPEDAPPELKGDLDRLSESIFRTTRYTDFALGEWVEGMKAMGLWKNALIVIVSDHGVAGTPYHAQWRDHPHFEEEAMSRINLVVAGGMVERVLASRNMTHLEWEAPVSQAQIAPFLANVAGVGDERFFGDHLLANDPKVAIVSDFGPRVYFPLASLVMERQQLMTEARGPSAYGPAFYRAFLLWMNTFNVVM